EHSVRGLVELPVYADAEQRIGSELRNHLSEFDAVHLRQHQHCEGVGPDAGNFGSLRAELHIPQVQSICGGWTGCADLCPDPQLGDDFAGCKTADIDRRALWSRYRVRTEPEF